MSKVCENCGNLIPDGTLICPNCGWEDDAVLRVMQSGMDTEEPETSKEKPISRERLQSQASRPRKSAPSAAKPKKKSPNMSVVGACIALVIILVIIIAAAVFMLKQMGFFVHMSDEELLQPAVESIAPSPSLPAAEPSAVEEPVVEESAEEPEESAAAPSEVSEETVECTKFKITGSEYPFLYSRGETMEVVYVIEPEDARGAIQWESSDESIATVSDYGVISARRGGSCIITGTCGDKKVTVYVTCQFTVPSTILDMNYEDVTMNYEGQTLELKIDYDLTDEQIKSTVWESSDETIATVDDKGLVTAVADGTAIISASIGEYTASCIVRCVNVTGNQGVNNVNSEYVINYQDVTLTRKGEYFQLTLKSVLGNNVPDFTWKSSNNKIATVDSKGIVTAVADGTCKITTSIGADAFECIVRVNISG